MSGNSSQAYQIKSIRYQNESRRILLQNENGPCPLLAAANALLLRGVLTLDPVCIRTGVASTNDVVNMLANRALAAGNREETKQEIVAETESSSHHNHHEYHLNEVLSLLPDLQHGMDVNPKFTSGPTGVEYTKNLAAFDLLGVELLHGWLLDPQDLEAVSVVESRTYNELIETVICGNEARDEVPKLEVELGEKEKELLGAGAGADGLLDKEQTSEDQNSEDNPELKKSDNTGTNDGEGRCVVNADDKQCADEADSGANNADDANDDTDTANSSQQKPTEENDIATLKKELADIRGKISKLSLQITRSEVANAFLTSSGHQLTYHGLEQLHKHMGDNSLCVFFRNNHFATLTKHNSVLYLLVTDLGYANTPEIVWEKLDNIDGDTEYTNEFFEKPTPRSELKPASGPTIAPELLLAQRSQAESDYQLALAMSKGGATTATSSSRMDDEEGKLIEAAKELSLKSFHEDNDAALNVGSDNNNPTSTTVGNNKSQIDSDMEVAMAYQRAQQQSEHDSEQLARQLQELEYARQRPAGATTVNTRRPAATAKSASASSNCVVS